MFNDSLFESSPMSVAVLRTSQWVVSILVGVFGSLAAYFGLPHVIAASQTELLVAQSGLIGMALSFWALMVCYVCADSRRLGLDTRFWTGLTLLLNFVGFFVYLIYSASRSGNSRRAAVPAAYFLEAVLVGALVLAPLIYTEALPKVLMGIQVPDLPLPRGVPRAATPTAKSPPRAKIDLTKTPILIPEHIPVITDPLSLQHEPPGQVLDIGLGDPPPGAPDGIFTRMSLGSAPPPPAPRIRRSRVAWIRGGGVVEAAKPIFAPKPEYPPLAIIARIQGTVRLEAIINKDGTIQDLKVLSGHPLLVKAAIDAVARWRYQPTLLNGEPVEVLTEIDVNFYLPQ